MTNQAPQPRLVELAEIPSADRGNLVVAECMAQVPFIVRRIFFLHGLPVGAERGDHAHKQQEQFFICPAGHARIDTEAGTVKKTFDLREPKQGLYVPPMVWVNLATADADTIIFVLVSGEYDESEYIRSYSDFLSHRGGSGNLNS